MSEKYTYDDVIINPNDPRVEIGAEYCFSDIPQNLVEAANSDYDFWGRLEKVSVSDGFNFKREGGGWNTCIIRKKEPKYVPFDLSKEEDRAKIRGAWVKANKDLDKEQTVCGVCSEYVYLSCQVEGYNAEDFLERFTFLDGTPCGKLIKED